MIDVKTDISANKLVLSQPYLVIGTEGIYKNSSSSMQSAGQSASVYTRTCYA